MLWIRYYFFTDPALALTSDQDLALALNFGSGFDLTCFKKHCLLYLFCPPVLRSSKFCIKKTHGNYLSLYTKYLMLCRGKLKNTFDLDLDHNMQIISDPNDPALRFLVFFPSNIVKFSISEGTRGTIANICLFPSEKAYISTGTY
jgi:hypothetical protein